MQPGCRIVYSYAFFVGVTGAASFLSWKPGWESDNVQIAHMSDDPVAPFANAFRAAGFEHQFVRSGAVPDDEASCRERIMASIDDGQPVVAFGPIGPPEAAIVTGYDEGGDVLIRWSFFQHMPGFGAGVEFEPSGQFRKRDWFDDPPGLILVGRKVPRPPLAETYRRVLAEARRYGSRFPIGMTEGGDGLVHRDAIEDLFHAAAWW